MSEAAYIGKRAVARFIQGEGFDPVAYDEQLVLAALIVEPQRHEWELSGLEPRLFKMAPHRAAAKALCDLRDSGRRVHWRRVKGALRKRGRDDLASFVDALFHAFGTSLGLTAAISRLHARAARRAA